MSEILPAHITIQQLGGTRRLSAMIGAHSFTHSNEGKTLTFQYRAKSPCNAIRITLNGLDLYDIEFIKIGRKLTVTTIETRENVDCDTLQQCIESVAKVYLSI